MIRSTHAGSWYPTGDRLSQNLDEVFSNAKVNELLPGDAKVVISPHAGYSYSAPTAAYGFKAVNPKLFNRVLILGPSHRVYITDCAIPNASQYETPFGSVALDVATINDIVHKFPKLFRKLENNIMEKEHSLELMLPYLKHIFQGNNFSIIPVMVGILEPSVLSAVANALSDIINDPKTLVVVSSDFCHWGMDFDYTYLPKGEGKIYQRIEQLDKMAMDAISTKNPNEFYKYIKDTGNTICGAQPIEIIMRGIKTEYSVEWPHYSQSSHVTSKHETSVSYASGIFRINQ